jgi:catechol 2,3-dioxygenase-like lactoylglutathione lyase family enzyme
MRLDGLHHITMITGDTQADVASYADVLGLRQVVLGFEHLGEALRLPRQHEHLRARLEQTLQPVVNPRAARREAVA